MLLARFKHRSRRSVLVCYNAGMSEQDPTPEAGIIDIEYSQDGNNALLHIQQIGGEVMKFSVPTKPLVPASPEQTPTKE